VDFCTEQGADGKPSIRAELQPEPASASVHVRSDGHEFANAQYASLKDYDTTQEMKMVGAISAVIARHMELNPEVFTAGEDVANLKGGAYGATKDALARFPERVLNAPIAEGGIVGLGHGAAVAGMRPIAEIMFCDFSLIAADELYNQVATARYMYNGKVDVPLIVRSRCSTGRGFGAQHSGDTAALYAMFPGWRIVAPTTPFDYVGLFNAAMRSLDPVFVLEHHELYPIDGPVPAHDLDYLVPLGKAAVRREGTDATILAYLSMVPRVQRIAEELAEENGLNLEVIDLRTLDYANVDFDTMGESLAKTGRAVIVEQAPQTQCLGPFLAAQLHERSNEGVPIRLVSSMPTPIPVSKVQEETVLISDATIRKTILETVGNRSQQHRSDRART
jgi:2-oxoisovalerate dehydrogenase E1 component